MRLFTAQMAKYRQLKGSNAYLLDSTVKTGNRVFAPTWDMVMGHKNGTLSDEGYTQQYQERMRDSFRRFKSEWLALFDHEIVVVFCYCGEGNFCHRRLLVPMFTGVADKYTLPFSYLGELKHATDIIVTS